MFTSPSQILCVSDYLGAKFFELKKETIIDLAPYVIVFGLIGARLYYCVLDYDFYMRFPTEILALRHGGISIHGAILGGLFGLILFSKRHNISFKKLCDVSAIGLALGQSIGRWGNFFNSEAYGAPTDLPWKLYIAPQYRHIPFLDVSYYHPAFLYESLLDLIIFGILLVLTLNKKFTKEGNVALIYLILYSLVRIFVESIRIDSVRYIQGVSIAIIVSTGIIILSGILLYFNNKEQRAEK